MVRQDIKKNQADRQPVWIVPAEPTVEKTLLNKVHHIQGSISGIIGSLGHLRHSSHTNIHVSDKKCTEKIVYIGCEHGGSDEFFVKLDRLVKNPPNFVFFAGDVSGSVDSAAFKKYFYNYVVNRVRPLLEKQTDIPDSELLQYIGENHPDDAKTLKDGYHKLMQFKYLYEEYDSSEIEQMLSNLTDKDIADDLRRISLLYSGQWMSELTSRAKLKLFLSYRKQAEKLLNVIKCMLKGGSEVYIVEGNEDSPISLQVIAGDDMKGVAFNTKEFFKENGIPINDTLTAVDTKTTLHILAPYFELLNYNPANTVYQEKVKMLKKEISDARREHRTVIIVAHGEPNWQVHYPGEESDGVRAKVIDHFRQLIVQFQPDEIVYNHQHDPLPYAPDKNAKYMLDGNGQIITEINKLKDSQTLVTYVPFEELEEIDIPIRGRLSRSKKGITGITLPPAIRKIA